MIRGLLTHDVSAADCKKSEEGVCSLDLRQLGGTMKTQTWRRRSRVGRAGVGRITRIAMNYQ